MEATQDQPANGQSIILSPDTPPASVEEAAPLVFDADARQHIPVSLLTDDGRYDVALVCEPALDAVMLQYARLCEKAGAADSAEDEDLGAAQHAAASSAVSWLFDRLMSDIEGIGDEGEEKPTDWRDIFSQQDRQTIIDRAVFGLEPVEPPAQKKKVRLTWGSHLRAVINRARAPFDGRLVDVSHTLRKADAKQLGEFVALYARTYGRGRAGDANMPAFAAGYDALHVADEGYRGDVPMHHKMAAYVHHMTRQGAAVRKN
jgi:hypothetical protein